MFRAGALASLFWTAAALAAPETRTPTAKWVVNFDDEQCVATRNYGTDEAPVFLVLKTPPVGNVLQIGVVRKGQRIDPRQVDGEVIFDSGSPIRTNLLEYGSTKLGQRALLVNLPAQKLAPLRTAKTMRILSRDSGVAPRGTRLPEDASYSDASFALSQMPQLLKMMDTCVADLRKVWNVPDGSGTRPPALKEPARGDIAPLFSPDDYPDVAMRKDQMGTLRMVLLINEAGRVADCTVVETSGIASLDAQSCSVVKERARFKPAIGLDGKPTKTYHERGITWRLE